MSKSFKEDLTDRNFGRWTVLEFVPNDKKSSYWKCMCDCGTIRTVWGADLKNGNSKSCGCTVSENTKKRNVRHNLSKTRLYRIWKALKQRCYYEKHKNYNQYGGRGIKVCETWKNDFQSFYDWSINNGYDDNLSIDRIDTNGNYEPNNCRWTNDTVQARNRRNTIYVEFRGQMITLGDVADKLGVNLKLLEQRYRNGDRGERLFRPTEKKQE